MMKKPVLILSILIVSFFVCRISAQNKIDSLKEVLKNISQVKNYKSDSIKINIFLLLGNYFGNTNPDSAFSYFAKAKKLATEVNDDLSLSHSLYFIGFTHFVTANNAEALKSFTLSLNTLQNYLKTKNKDIHVKALKIQAKVYNAIGAVYNSKGNYPLALDFYLKSLKINEEIKNSIEQKRNYDNIGLLYLSQRNYEKALFYFLKALKMAEKTRNKLSILSSLTNISQLYLAKGDQEKALNSYFEALKLEEDAKSIFIKTSIMSNIGGIYSDRGNYKNALLYFFNSLSLTKKSGDKSTEVIILENIAGVHIKQKKYILAENILKKTIKVALEIESLEDIKQIHEDFYKIYEETKRPALALESYKQFIIYRDSINNVENDKAIIQKELQYNYDKKATADSIVNAKAQEIKDTQLAKNKLEIKAKQNQQYVLFGGLALVLVFAGFMYNRFKITQRQKVIIEEQKKLVDISQKKTMDSINYAKKIQHSILPSSEQLGFVFPNHFIFFKPKDIVSGDFYWFYHQNNLSFIAVADCTGHGVPGAFMTMIGYSNLIEVVAQQKVIEPNKILENLHQHIFNNLQQNKGDAYSQDGMDISLVVIDHENSLLHFSGAYNHGYLIHNKQIHTLKATSKSIGGLSILGEVEPERNFKAETIPFTKGSLLILTTDGIFDQLNKQDEKFGNERFKELALNFNSESAQENLNLVEQTYNNWKQDAQQLDDLCLLGLVI